ncbi:MAG TPA: N-succinylglutamate 5-semialdehyde dehydrogenase, partial [Gammaproteobacteria bacterium]|nr:N-succinylglutamate 5-semialdehyde dehydrogenase [Gammaproteobacteria bacterium]
VEMTQPDSSLAFVTPGIIDVTGIDVPDEEDFGPLLKVYLVDSLEDAIKEGNNTIYGLSAGLISEKTEDWAVFQKKIRAGIVNWNKPTTGASGKAPFGGPGASGNYRPGAYYAADYCAYPMASVATEKPTLPASLAPGIEL